MSDPGYVYAAVNDLAYQSSKAALNAITIVYAKELAQASIKVNAADSGLTATDFNHHRAPVRTGHRPHRPGRRAAYPIGSTPQGE